MKKLLLILPRNERGYWEKLSKSGKAGFARLSLTTVAALTPSHWAVEILDARITPIDFTQQTDLVGITAFTTEVPSAYEIADGFRARGIKVVMGGIHASALPDEALQHADAVVVGEAEYVWQELIKDAEQEKLKSVYKSESLIEMTGMAIPRRELLNREMYTLFNTLQATRGCPFNCEYCSVTAFFGNKYRTRPIEEVIDEIRGFDGREFFFTDDNIIGHPKYSKELFCALIPLKRKWGGQTTIHLARDKELLSLYTQSGGRYAFIGFESLSEKNLRQMKKSWNSLDFYKEAIKQIHNAGINIIGSFIFGLDDDDESVFQNTIDFIVENKIDAAQFHILTPFPGTNLYQSMEKEGKIVDRDWSKYNTCEVVFKPKNMTVQELQRGYYRAYHEIYSLKNILKRSLRSPRNILLRIVMNLSYRRKALKMPND